MRDGLKAWLVCVAMGITGPLAAQQLVLSRGSFPNLGLYTVNTSTGVATLVPGTDTVWLSGIGSRRGGEVLGYRTGESESGRRVRLSNAAIEVLPRHGASGDAGMDCNPATGDCWLANNFFFSRVDPGTGAAVALTGPMANINGLAYAPGGAAGYVYGVGGADLLRYDIASDTWSTIGPIGFSVGFAGLAYDPTGGVLYMVQGGGSGLRGVLYTVNTTTGAATQVGATGLGTGFVQYGLTWVGVESPASGVDVSAATPSPVRYAREIAASETNPVTLSSPFDALNLTSALGYSFSQGEVRHARIECPSHVRFNAGSTVVASDTAATSLGAINGLGTSVITFSITANNTGLTATDTVTVTGNRSITSTADASCSFSLFDNPSQAQAGGTAGRIVTRAGAYLSFGPSWQLVADPVFTSMADVEANPSYTAFVASGDTTTTRAGLSELTYGLVTPTPLRPDGMAITLADLMATGATGTRLAVTGDFELAANADGSYTGAALNRVFLATDDTCTTLATAAAALTVTTATFNVGATVLTDDNVCVQANGTTAILSVDYAAQILPVAASAAYRVSPSTPILAGRVVRNGVELQAPLVQVPAGFTSRVALTNTGSIARTFSWRFLPASGGTASEGGTTTSGAVTGTGRIPANGLTVIGLSDVLGGFGTTPPRGTFVVTASAPTGQVQGLYQIVNPTNGTTSNTVMVRPGTN